MSETDAIRATGLTKRFSKRPVLDGLDMTIKSGAAVGLLGANGTGKTTLIRSILGLLPVEGGNCEVLGDPSTSLSSAIRSRIGYVPQVPNQFEWLSGRAMLKYIAHFYPAFDWPYVEQLAERWKLSLKTPIGTLSPGQQQRLSIVRALAPRPEVIILDEPIASLDPATRIAVIDELLSERRQRSVSILFSSHLIGDLERLCSQFAILSGGKIVAMESLDWFRKLIRVHLTGAEPALASLAADGLKMVRRPSEGRRVAVLPREDLQRLTGTLATGVAVSIEEPDLESLVSEWMQ